MKSPTPKPPKHGVVRDNILYKNGKQAIKFWKYDGYGVNVADLHEVNGIVLDTKYNGRIYAPVSVLREHGIHHWFGDEEQLVLKVEFWKEIK